MADVRGNPWEHDPGPTAASGWAELFAETPNYRGLGRAVLGREAFRWHHGPMFYRGRLDGSAKVLIVGQEGAQDESLSHRSFTGGTGARMQHLLRFIGLDRSYLFLNSFVYPIFGQYTQDLRKLAQDPRSPIVKHRNRIFDKAVVDGDVRLVVAVGRAAKESVATWIEAHGGTADPEALHNATLGSIPNRVLVVGVLHPGGAAGGSTAEHQGRLPARHRPHQGRLQDQPTWLPVDAGMTRNLSTAYPYSSAAIPYRDFPFGTCPRLGRGGTSSNRSDNQRGIRLFSAAGKYNAEGAHLSDPSTAAGSNAGYDDDPGDLPYEPPRANPRAFDAGPPAALARSCSAAEPGFDWPDFAALGVTSHPSFGVGPIYRGRSASSASWSSPTSDPTTTCSRRGRSGRGGSALPGLPARSRSDQALPHHPLAPVDTLDLTPAAATLVDHPEVQALHRELLRRVAEATRASRRSWPSARRSSARAQRRTGGSTSSSSPPRGAGCPRPGRRPHGRSRPGYTKDLTNPTFVAPRPEPAAAHRPAVRHAALGGHLRRPRRAPDDTDLGKPSPDYLKLFLPSWVAACRGPPHGGRAAGGRPAHLTLSPNFRGNEKKATSCRSTRGGALRARGAGRHDGRARLLAPGASRLHSWRGHAAVGRTAHGARGAALFAIAQ